MRVSLVDRLSLWGTLETVVRAPFCAPGLGTDRPDVGKLSEMTGHPVTMGVADGFAYLVRFSDTVAPASRRAAPEV